MKKHIHESNLIEGFDDAHADELSMAAWKWLIKQPEITKDVICQLQKRITAFQDDLKPSWKGNYRKISVMVGWRVCPHPQAVPAMMADWIYQLKWDEVEPKAHHISFEKIHPFVDGNGRTGRMLMWWQQKKRGEKPSLILDSKKQEYYAWFK